MCQVVWIMLMGKKDPKRGLQAFTDLFVPSMGVWIDTTNYVDRNCLWAHTHEELVRYSLLSEIFTF